MPSGAGSSMLLYFLPLNQITNAATMNTINSAPPIVINGRLRRTGEVLSAGLSSRRLTLFAAPVCTCSIARELRHVGLDDIAKRTHLRLRMYTTYLADGRQRLRNACSYARTVPFPSATIHQLDKDMAHTCYSQPALYLPQSDAKPWRSHPRYVSISSSRSPTRPTPPETNRKVQSAKSSIRNTRNDRCELEANHRHPQ